MRKLFYFSLITLLLGGSMYACSKSDINPAATSSGTTENAVWRTPNGYVIPYSEKDNWKDYLKSQLANEKEDIKRYKSQACSTPDFACGLECVLTTDKYADCIKASACAPCMNCCPPIVGK